MSRPLVGFYGDDFTGSVDALLQYRRTGLSGALVTDAGRLADASSGWDVIGVAGTARALPTAQMDAEITPALAALAGLATRLVQYKASSTADSSARTGSLGRAVELGRRLVGGPLTPVLLAQPDFGRYTVFGNHFAADAGVVHRLDRHPTMSRHPVSPMTEADLAALLGSQTGLGVGSLPLIGRADAGTPDALIPSGGPVPDIVVLDALTESDLAWAGEAVLALPERPVFALGSGGLSRAVGLALAGTAERLPASCDPASGPVLVVSGSCSRLTWRQVQDAGARGWRTVDALASVDPVAETLHAIAAGTSVVVHSARPGGASAPDAQIAELLADVVTAVATAGPLTRMVVAGGDTSGRVLRLLGVTAVEIEAAPWGNTALCRVTGGVLDNVQLVLKGGQMGPPDLFERVRLGAALAGDLTAR